MGSNGRKADGIIYRNDCKGVFGIVLDKNENHNVFSLRLEVDLILLGALLVVGLLCSFFSPSIIAVVVTCITFVLCVRGNGVCVLPILLFYYNYFGYVAGIRTFYVCAILFIGFEIKRNLKIQKDVLLLMVLFVYSLYLLLVLSFLNIKSVIWVALAVITMLLAKKELLSDRERMKLFFKVFGLAALVSYFTGLFSENVYESVLILSGKASTVVRTMGTFNDPNYMGLFYSVAAFSIITLELFGKKLRIVIVGALYIMLATTLSMTAILGNIVFWIIYLLITKKLNLKTVLVIVAVIGISIGVYSYGITHQNVPYLGDLSARISDKLQNMDDFNSLTTGRAGHTKAHWEYYCNQNWFKILFGGNYVNSIAVDPHIDVIAAHNEYVDLLLNVGLIGTMILLGYLFRRLFQEYENYRRNRYNQQALCLFMVKVIYVFYAATLTMFMENRFLLFYFL